MSQENYWENYKKKIIIFIAIAIFSIGTFLRSYRFHDWLDFGDDQVNDATIVGNVVDNHAPWPLLGPGMSHSGNAESGRKKQYHLGPMFYYFEITSAKIFGDYPDKLAYPNWLFDVLSLPLFFIFFKRLFSTNITLALTGLYAVSFYVLGFSHSAWNPNSIPFFVWLFLLSLDEFLVQKGKTGWKWAIFLGLALGIGIQLHAILLVLLPLVTAIIFFFLLKKNWLAWKKWGAVFLIALILNTPQIVSELHKNFANSKIFFRSLQSDSGTGNGTILENIPLDISCHVQANAYILSSLGGNECNFSFTNSARWGKISFSSWADLLFGVLFSAFGYGILIYSFRAEKEEKRKYFLGLLLLFITIAYLVMLPVVDKPFRYFLPTVFAPFLFLGLLAEYLIRKYSKNFLPLLVMIFSLVLATNFLSTQAAAKELLSHTRNSQDHIVLGETEIMVNYIIAHVADTQREAYLLTDQENINFLKPVAFIAQKKQFQILEAKSIDKIILGKPVFYVQSSSKEENDNSGKFVASKNFGQVTLYQLTN